MRELILLQSADFDIQAGFEHYENGGTDFFNDVDSTLFYLKNHPYLGRPSIGKFRRLRLRKFPFAIFYVVYPLRITVHYVLDLRMDPETINQLLERS